jgi:hypothetical protein
VPLLSFVRLPSAAMDYWKSKVLPKMKLVFVKTGGSKKAAAAELAKAFDESKVIFDRSPFLALIICHV